MKKRTITITLLLTVFIISILSSTIQPSISGGKGIPSQPISFSLVDDSNSIGFINPDGSNYETRKVMLPVGIIFDQNIFKHYSSKIDRMLSVHWSEKGNTIGLILTAAFPGSGYPILIDNTGKFSYCYNKQRKPITTHLFYKVINDDLVLLPDTINESGNPHSLIIYNLKTCNIEKELYRIEENLYIVSADIYNNSLLAIVIENQSEQYEKDQLIIYDIEKKQILQSFSGEEYRDVAWSHDGTKLALLGINLETSKSEMKILDVSSKRTIGYTKADSSPSWSPDDRQVVFSLFGRIYIYDIASKSTVLLTNGWEPSWRP